MFCKQNWKNDPLFDHFSVQKTSDLALFYNGKVYFVRFGVIIEKLIFHYKTKLNHPFVGRKMIKQWIVFSVIAYRTQLKIILLHPTIIEKIEKIEKTEKTEKTMTPKPPPGLLGTPEDSWGLLRTPEDSNKNKKQKQKQKQ